MSDIVLSFLIYSSQSLFVYLSVPLSFYIYLSLVALVVYIMLP